MALEESGNEFLHVIISLAILLFTAKIFAEIFHRLKMPVVLGELLAGIIIGPFAVGGLILFDGEPLVVLDETIRNIGQISAIVILFVAGLEITPREFLRGGAASFTVGSIGVIVPFFVGFAVLTLFGLEALEWLSVVTTMVQTGDTSPQIMDVIFLILQILGLFAALLIGSIVLIPRLLHVEKLWKSKGSIEGIVIASFFGAAGIAAFVGLSPIVGAFAVGMAVVHVLSNRSMNMLKNC